MLTTIKSFGKLASHCLEIKSSAKSQIAQIAFSKFFVNVAATLGIKYEKLLSNYDDGNCSLDEIVVRYNKHPSTFGIKINAQN